MNDCWWKIQNILAFKWVVCLLSKIQITNFVLAISEFAWQYFTVSMVHCWRFLEKQSYPRKLQFPEHLSSIGVFSCFWIRHVHHIPLRPVKTKPTCWSNIIQHCWMQHVGLVWTLCWMMLEDVGLILNLVKTFVQHCATFEEYVWRLHRFHWDLRFYPYQN